jgi:hypothetical protein
MRGLSMADADRMTMGMWIDYIIEWNNLNKSNDAEKDDRSAGQTDFDAF